MLPAVWPSTAAAAHVSIHSRCKGAPQWMDQRSLCSMQHTCLYPRLSHRHVADHIRRTDQSGERCCHGRSEPCAQTILCLTRASARRAHGSGSRLPSFLASHVAQGFVDRALEGLIAPILIHRTQPNAEAGGGTGFPDHDFGIQDVAFHQRLELLEHLGVDGDETSKNAKRNLV